METLKEDLIKNTEHNNKNMETLKADLKEELGKKIDDVSKRIKENTEKIQLWREEIKNDGKPTIEETPNVEQLNKETENKSEPSIEAVSYTHLDVYKRQNQSSSLFKKKIFNT